MKRYANPRGTLVFIIIAVVFMLAAHFLMNGGHSGTQMQDDVDDTPQNFKTSLSYPHASGQSPRTEYFAIPELENDEFSEIINAYAVPEPSGEAVEKIAVVEKAKPKVAKKVALPKYEPLRVEGSPKIAIIIDDMGVDRRRSFKVLDIDAPLTLAFLPYAEQLEGITQEAKSKGHELMIHMPMEAMTNPVSLGPIALKDGMSQDEVFDNLDQAFESFDGYVGLNNHMGSRVTQNPAIMDAVMQRLKNKGLYFIDSKTIGSSVGVEMARQNGLRAAARDVFLDHESTPEFVSKALRKTERTAARQGYAIAIGHPKDATINGLQSWVDDVRARGFEIVHASELVGVPKVAKIASAPEPVQKIKTVERVPEKHVVEHIVHEAQPAAGDELGGPVDPNSPEAREEILKRLLGQAETP